jgi:RNA polymerase sigma-70 factor (ECF subfamily)
LFFNEVFLYKFAGSGVYGLKPVPAHAHDHPCARPRFAPGRHFEMNFDWETFYEAKAAGLILYGRALGLGHGEAEDVLQETFLALLVAPPPGMVPAKPENYCVRAYRNRALNYKRSLWRSLRTAAFLRDFAESHWFEKPPDESLQTATMQDAAVRCLKELPVEQREVIVLKIWNELTFEEIGGLLEISPNTAAGRYRYGLQKLKSKLEGVVYERDGFTGEPTALVASAPAFARA